MGRPFKIQSAQAPRDDRGRFVQLTPPSPPAIVDEARRTGTSVDEVVADQRVPDHPIESVTKTANGGYQVEPARAPTPAPHKPMRVS